MRQLIIALNLIGSFIVLSLTIDLFDALFMFLLFGILPGRIEPLSANQMMGIYLVATIAVASYSLRSSFSALAKLTTRPRHHVAPRAS